MEGSENQACKIEGVANKVNSNEKGNPRVPGKKVPTNVFANNSNNNSNNNVIYIALYSKALKRLKIKEKKNRIIELTLPKK